MLSLGDQAIRAARPRWPSVHPFNGIALLWGDVGANRLWASDRALLYTYYVQECSGSFTVWLSSAVILPLPHPLPLQTISISLSLAWLTGNTAREVKSPGLSEPSVRTTWRCL